MFSNFIETGHVLRRPTLVGVEPDGEGLVSSVDDLERQLSPQLSLLIALLSDSLLLRSELLAATLAKLVLIPILKLIDRCRPNRGARLT